MKKFLSSLLALTMILSLVIVPANASGAVSDQGSPTNTVTTGNGQDTSPAGPGAGDASTTTYQVTGKVTVTAKPATVTSKKQQVTFTASTSGLTVQQKTGEDSEWSNLPSGTIPTYTYTWKIGDDEQESATDKTFTTTFTLGNSDVTKTVTCTVGVKVDETTVNAATGDNNSLSGSAQVTVKAPTLTISAYGNAVTASDTIEVIEGGVLTLSASSTGVDDPHYVWEVNNQSVSTKASYDVKNDDTKTASDTVTTVTCKVYEGEVTDESTPVTTATCTYKVVDTKLSLSLNGGKPVVLTAKGATKDVTAVLSEKNGVQSSPVNSGVEYHFSLSKSGVALISSRDNSTGKTTITLDGKGIVTLTVEATYKGVTKTASIEVAGEILSASLGKVENGGKLSFDYDDLKSIIDHELRGNVTVKNGSDITLTNYPTSDRDGGKLYDGNSQVTRTCVLDSNDDLDFYAAAGYIGDATMTATVIGSDTNTYTVTITISVTSAGDIDGTVTGSSANSSVSFDVDDVVSYKKLYIRGSRSGSSSSATLTPSSLSSSSNYDGYWDGNKTPDWALYDEDDTVTIPASEFSKSTGKVTLYVVGLDKDGDAYTGKIVVSQKSYDISYNVVAGKSVSFNQKDFESFLEDYAEDNGNYNPKKDEITFDHAVLTSSIPSAKSEGTLYYGSTEITSSNRSKTEMTDMDKVSFDSVSKPTKDTVTLTFRVYGEIEKPNSRKPDKVNYDVNVVISVVKEDITYTVGIDDTVQLTARDFVNFLQDARTSYRKAELDYVKFDVSGKNVSSYAYGGLYRSYSSYSTGKLADSTDKFYYEPSRTQYDLADVAYHTTRWAEAGKTVYIPFTVYGTKNEEASGTMAITIAQTMNFIDVKASDFFYEPVKWAVNNKITNGTSSTTFSPYKNCNRAEIVTFLWRAAGTPEPTVTRNPFTDVNSVRDASYYKAILWASQKGITAGTTATTFSPYQECTRSQIVTFLYRYAGKPSGNYTNPFKDVSSVNEASYYNAILWAVGKGITQGTSTTTFSPYASCTRGEAVTFLYRYVNGVK